eukprot:4969794-Ditylum_brightwellii.AAC.1
MDIAFDALIMLRLQGLMPDPDSYSCMMDIICNQSGDIWQVTLLLSRIKEDGLVVDSGYVLETHVYSNINSALGGFGSDGLGISDGHLPPALSSAQEAAQSSSQ